MHMKTHHDISNLMNHILETVVYYLLVIFIIKCYPVGVHKLWMVVFNYVIVVASGFCDIKNPGQLHVQPSQETCCVTEQEI